MQEQMKCPDCAEEILVAAKKCRFCGRAITEADRRGFPSFYNHILSMGLGSPEIVLMDYGDYAIPGQTGELNVSCLVASLIQCGELNEFDLIRAVRQALFDRAFEIADSVGLAGPEAIESTFPEIKNEELKAVYLSARYMSVCSQFGKKWDGTDPRREASSLKFAVETLSELRDLAKSANPEMGGFVSQFESEIQFVREALEKTRPAPAAKSSEQTPRSIPPNRTSTDKQNTTSSIVKVGVAVIVVIIIIAAFL